MLEVKCPELLDEAKAFADKAGLAVNLQQNLDFLDNYAGKENTVCVLSKDFALLSFNFTVYRLINGERKLWFNGGLLFHGSHDGHGSGAAPTLAVTLEPTTGWSIHT
jgi:hypothetical protein